MTASVSNGSGGEVQGYGTSATCILTDGEERPGNDGRASRVALGRRERVSCRRRLEEHKREEDEQLGPESGTVNVGVDAKGLEERDDNEHNGPCRRQ